MGITQNQNIDFLTGGGECGEIIRSIDWSKTPVGPVEHWPQSLKTCIRIVLTSRQPMFVWWGKELINIYNDPYKTIVGGKHPEALGLPASVVWREIWDQVGPRAEKAMLNNQGTYDEALLLIMERNGYPEETYYTFSYSPVPGDHGEPGGIICANTDDTQRIIGERQLRTLRDLGKNVFENKTEKEVYEKSIRVLKQNPHDFPFALLYKTDPGDTFIHLATGTEALSENIFPVSIDMNNPGLQWPLEELLNSGKEKIIEINESIGKLPAGAWDKQPNKILILPVIQSGQKNPYAFLFIGLNRYSLFDEKHQGFYQLVADQISSNISDIRAYEDERKRAEALAEIDKAKTVFFSNISHEFRTPLTLMISPLQDALRENNSLPAALKENLEVSYRNTLRLQKLVNRLLDFSRIEAGRMHVSYQLTDISALTRDIASNFRSAVEKAGMKLIVDCGTIPDQVYIDRDMWEKIVLNLLSNAFKYTHQGTIKVIIKKNNEHVELSVIDTGVGIPESEIDKVFDRFHRVQHARGRTQEGTGIGLSLVQELVKLHHGNIRVTSKVNEGSTFSVIIPLGKKHLDDDKIYKSTLHLPPASSPDAYLEEALKWIPPNDGNKISGNNIAENISQKPGRKDKIKPHIILADDNEDMRNYIHRLLNDNYEVTAVKNGKEVLKNVETKIPDLVISDVMMPEIDGFELVKRLKKNTRTANIPIVLLSARAGEEATIEGLKTGADDYLVKPFSARELLTRIDSTLKIAENRRAAEQNLKNIFTQSPMPIAIFRSADLIVELANKSYMQVIDRDEEGFIGKPLLEGFPELKGQGIVELLTGVINTGVPYYGNEFKIDIFRNNQKEKCYFNFVYYPLRGTDDKIDRVMVMANDVTEQINARQKIEESGKKFRSMVMQSPIAMAVLRGKDMIIDIANDTLLKNIWQREPNEVEGKQLLEVFPELKNQRFPKLLDDVLNTGKPYRENDAETFVKWKDGLKKFYLDYEYAPTIEPDGSISGIILTVADVTEKAEARQKVEEMEQRSRLAIDAAEMGTFDWNLVDQQFISSPRLIEIFGFKNHPETSHQDLLNAFHPEDKPIRDRSVEKSYEKGSLSYEARVIWPDKTIRWVMVNGKTIFDEHRKAMRMYGTVMDITEEKKIVKDLEESEALLKSVVDSAPVMIWMSSVDKSTTLINKAFLDFTGRTMEEELGFGWTDSVHPDDFQYCLDTYVSLFDARKEIHLEYRLKRSDGKYRWVSDKGIPRYSSDGNFLGYIGGCADIHEQKMALDELERLIAERTSELKSRNDELQQQKDFVDVILDSSVDVISVFDTEKRYISLNRRCEEVYGMKKENMLGKKIEELFPQTINTDFYHGLSQAILGNNIHHPKYQSVVTGRNYETFYIPLKHDGKVNAVLAIAHDNTDIIEAAERLQFSNIELGQKNKELEWSNNELEQFAYVASHDLQEPLRKIRTYSGILYEHMKSEIGGSSLQTLQKIMNSAERMSTLIYDLLNFSRLIHPEKSFEPTDLNKIIRNVINDFELTIQQKQATIHVDTLPTIRATPLQMNQLFYNLVNNSLKFSKENVTPVITITSTVMKRGQVVKLKNLNPDLNYIDITVKDNGIGFDQQYAEQIFEVFKRLQNKNIYPGSGIGLALCRKILLNHQGDIYAEGNENEGAVFHIILPDGYE